MFVDRNKNIFVVKFCIFVIMYFKCICIYIYNVYLYGLYCIFIKIYMMNMENIYMYNLYVFLIVVFNIFFINFYVDLGIGLYVI